MKKQYYAVKRGRKFGIFDTWKECKEQVDHFVGAKYKGFYDKESAEIWLGIKKAPPLERDVLHIWTDGACSGNPGPGGWAYIMRYNEHSSQGSGHSDHTTNNRMELNAMLEGIMAIKDPSVPKEVRLYTDSTYVIHAINKGTGVSNAELMFALHNLVKALQKYTMVVLIKVPGHAGDKMNEKVDKLAVAARDISNSK